MPTPADKKWTKDCHGKECLVTVKRGVPLGVVCSETIVESQSCENSTNN